MLVLSRRPDEKIIIGDGLVTITIVSVDGRKVRVGIEAPKGLSVHREEVLAQIKSKGLNKDASNSD